MSPRKFKIDGDVLWGGTPGASPAPRCIDKGEDQPGRDPTIRKGWHPQDLPGRGRLEATPGGPVKGGTPPRLSGNVVGTTATGHPGPTGPQALSSAGRRPS